MTTYLSRALETLKGKGVRMTPQRQAILTYIMDTDSHPTADQIYKALADKFPHMSVATVYNNLRKFKEAGLVRELTFGDASSRFDGKTTDHYHVVCRLCYKVVDFEFPYLKNVEDVAAEATQFVVDSHRMEVYGYCLDCAPTQKQ